MEITLPKTQLVLFAYKSVLPQTHACIVRDARLWPELQIEWAGQDALIDRARSRVASGFLSTPLDVLIMVDHDISWYPGDLQRIAENAEKVKGVVAGVYSTRSFGTPLPIRVCTTGEYDIPSDVLLPCDAVSAGFMAIHRSVLEKLTRDSAFGDVVRCHDGMYPFFLPIISEAEGRVEELSEDWAFCKRVRDADLLVYADLAPRPVHTGEWDFRQIDATLKMPPTQAVTVAFAGAEKEKAT